jgi:hypothetical protein
MNQRNAVYMCVIRNCACVDNMAGSSGDLEAGSYSKVRAVFRLGMNVSVHERKSNN